jgi:FdhD protein
MADSTRSLKSAGQVSSRRLAYRDQRFEPGERILPEETAIALVHDASTTAVMMATPDDLEDFGLGFSLTEGLITQPDELHGLEVIPGELGVEVRMWLAPPRSEILMARRRRLVGPTGCGLCGVESLAEAVKTPLPVAAGIAITADQVLQAVGALAGLQPLGAATRAVHAAGYWTPDEGLALLREDVGRHNALDKLAGALATSGRRAADGAIVLTSRVSVEMVQKSAAIGAPILIAVSAPTALAVELAKQTAVTLVAVARSDGFEVFSGARRIK